MTPSREEIIDVLRPLAEAADEFDERPGIHDPEQVFLWAQSGRNAKQVTVGDARRARDLLSRLEAPGEIESHLDKNDQQLMEQALRHPPLNIPDTARAIDRGPRLHVAPPASDSSSGRADEPLLKRSDEDAAEYDYLLTQESHINDALLAVEKVLRDAVALGFLSGRRSMQEEAAKVVEGHELGATWYRGGSIKDDIAAQIRALNPETKP